MKDNNSNKWHESCMMSSETEYSYWYMIIKEKKNDKWSVEKHVVKCMLETTNINVWTITKTAR
jgi:hypothetical protein